MMPGHFNSRPHKEVDTIRNPNHTTRCAISTHDLTRRSTEKRGIDGGLSEFQLTTSQGGRPSAAGTLRPACRYFNSRPHKEVDLFHQIWILSQDHFNSRPREEVDVGGADPTNGRNISTHDLAKRSTISQVRCYHTHNYFNSRPREEVDNNILNWTHGNLYFNSRPREEVDASRFCLSRRKSHFNSRPHEEVDY